MRTLVAALPALFLFAVPAAAADDAAVGIVKTAVGSVTLVRDGAAQPASAGMLLHEKDRLETGSDGELGVTFRDDTRVSLGPSSRMDLSRFVFKPATREYSLVLRLTFGTLQYLSGLTAKLMPDSVSIETPNSTIGVRGTRILVRAER